MTFLFDGGDDDDQTQPAPMAPEEDVPTSEGEFIAHPADLPVPGDDDIDGSKLGG